MRPQAGSKRRVARREADDPLPVMCRSCGDEMWFAFEHDTIDADVYRCRCRKLTLVASPGGHPGGAPEPEPEPEPAPPKPSAPVQPPEGKPDCPF